MARRTRSTREIGIIVLALYLIITGAAPFLNIQLGFLGALMAIIAGVLLLLDSR
jgi:hypothetical protein